MSHDPHNLDGFHGQRSGGWEKTPYGWESDARADEAQAKRTEHYVVTFTISYDPEEIANIRSWMTQEYLQAIITEGSETIDVSTVAIEENPAVDDK